MLSASQSFLTHKKSRPVLAHRAGKENQSQTILSADILPRREEKGKVENAKS